MSIPFALDLFFFFTYAHGIIGISSYFGIFSICTTTRKQIYDLSFTSNRVHIVPEQTLKKSRRSSLAPFKVQSGIRARQHMENMLAEALFHFSSVDTD